MFRFVNAASLYFSGVSTSKGETREVFLGSLFLSPRAGARPFFFFPFRVAEMEESLDAEPRLFVGQVREEGEGGRRRRREDKD